MPDPVDTATCDSLERTGTGASAPGDGGAVDLACETLYRFFSAALGHPRNPEWAIVADSPSRRIAADAARLLRREFSVAAIPLGFGELPVDELDLEPALAELPTSRDDALGEYTRVFGLIPCRKCPPYESEYLSIEDTFFRTQQMADVAGFYRAFGVDPGSHARERPDHVCLELEFSAFLLLKEREAAGSGDTDAAAHVETCRAARKTFFTEHLGWWMPAFCTGLRRKAGTGPYEAIARQLAAFLAIERHRFGVRPSPTPREPNVAEADDCDGCLVQLNAPE